MKKVERERKDYEIKKTKMINDQEREESEESEKGGENEGENECGEERER